MMLICLAAMNDAPGVDRPPTGAPRKRVFDFLLADASPAPRRDRDEWRGDEPRSDRPGRPERPLPADLLHAARSRGRRPARLGAHPRDRVERIDDIGPLRDAVDATHGQRAEIPDVVGKHMG
jgi:hypothetical protein